MIAEEIRTVLSAKADALLRRSADDMAALLHPDFVYVNAAGYKLDKADYIKLGIAASSSGKTDAGCGAPARRCGRSDPSWG